MVKVVKGLQAGWGVCSRTTLLGDYPFTLSHHNNRIAVGSELGDIIILNAITGSQSGVLSGHTNVVRCVVFSSDGTSLVSGSWDKTVKLWDVQTGGVVKTFFGHKGQLQSVSISADSTTIASGSFDKTICLWNVQTGECYHTIQQQSTVFHVIFSPTDPEYLISISDKKVWQWGISCCQIRSPFDGSHAAFSSDGAQFVSCFETTVTVHNSSSGVIVAEFQMVDDTFRCCFSPDNGLVAVTVDRTVCCWDITTSKPQLVDTFIGHTDAIYALIFSSPTTLISASYDKSVKFWQIGAQSIDPVMTGLKYMPLPSASIESVTLQSKEGIAIACDSNGVIKTWDVSTGICKTSFQTPAKGSDRQDIRLVDGRLIIVWSINREVYAWDIENGELLWKMYGPWNGVDDLKISGGGSWVCGLGGPDLGAWSLQTGEVMVKMKIDNGGHDGTLIVDGSKVWVCWNKSDYEGWDFGITGSIPVELSTLPGSRKLWDPEKAWIKNPATGEVVFQLSGTFGNPASVQCDDSYLVAGCGSGEILILDLTNVE